MAQWRCLEKCWWDNVFWSPQPDGKQVYTGDKTPPQSKSGKPFFVLIDPPTDTAKRSGEPAEKQPDIAEKQADESTELVKEYMIRRMNKHELLGIMEKKYRMKFSDEEVTREQLVKMVIEKQEEFKTNQDIANQAKG